jgi:RNA polymerase sigma-70 factor (ECF subfamily)
MTHSLIYNASPSNWTNTVADSASEAARQRALDTFLAGVERRAFVIAELATRNPEDALDLVQDAMLAFVASYGNKPRGDWPPLFHRVLQNRIRDWYRRQAVRNRWRVWLKGAGQDDAGEDRSDPLQQAGDPAGRSPEELVALHDAGDALLDAIAALPLRQQQAFVLRTWEALDVADTARAMGCSAGSVKTHLSRAMSSLRDKLKGHW